MSDRHRLRAPRQDRAVVADPPLAEGGAMLSANRDRLGGLGFDVLGRPATDLRRHAAREMVAAARAYLQNAGEPVPAGPADSLVLAGHQPELFHPGVWLKNFALNGLARRHGATPLNLIVDNDTAKPTAISVPVLASGNSAWPRLVKVPFDHWGGETPYEERAVADEETFAAFADRVAERTAGWEFHPLLPDFWAEARRQARRTNLLGERLAAARRVLERQWGCHNLELPVSALCATESFAWFAGHLLTELPRLHQVYNDAVREYRRLNHIRSRHHPVPDLAVDGDWLESPFWAWRAGQPRRARLFARRTGSGLELRAGPDLWPTLPPEPGRLVAAWRGLEAAGLRVRSRALTNTLFARLFLGDLFVHGIGGGKYDELTDAIARRFYGIEPPGYVVFSATLLLPFRAYPETADDCRRLARELRDLHWNPQRHLDGMGGRSSEATALAEQKQRWIGRQPATSAERRERFQQLRALTGQLQARAESREKRLARELKVCVHRTEANAVLQRRDYCFCLYPEWQFKPFCQQFLATPSRNLEEGTKNSRES